MEDEGVREEEGLTEDGCRRRPRCAVTAKRGHRRAYERNTAAAGAPSGEDQPEPSSRHLVVLDALPEGELVDLVLPEGEPEPSSRHLVVLDVLPEGEWRREEAAWG
jgi:hypothetical protein